MGNSSRLYREFNQSSFNAIPANKTRRFSTGKLSSATTFQSDIIPKRLPQPKRLSPFPFFLSASFVDFYSQATWTRLPNPKRL